ncbi:MAG: carboxypeptidase-like regulatory domain-containing protein, partial [Acidobacteriota bacterium]|nr:carboxypeptidase-like regulatory domain-containing protein [Acidobacteriota bacterium]
MTFAQELVRGTVMLAEGSALAGATVEVREGSSPCSPDSSSQPPAASAETSEDGSFRIPVAASGVVRWSVRSPGRMPMILDPWAAHEGTSLPPVRLAPSTSLIVEVQAAGEPFAGATVGLEVPGPAAGSDAEEGGEARLEWRPDSQRALTGADGKVRLAVGDRATIEVRAPGKAPRTLTWEHHDGAGAHGQESLVVKLEPGRPTAVRLEDLRGRNMAELLPCLRGLPAGQPSGTGGETILWLALPEPAEGTSADLAAEVEPRKWVDELRLVSSSGDQVYRAKRISTEEPAPDQAAFPVRDSEVPIHVLQVEPWVGPFQPSRRAAGGGARIEGWVVDGKGRGIEKARVELIPAEFRSGTGPETQNDAQDELRRGEIRTAPDGFFAFPVEGEGESDSVENSRQVILRVDHPDFRSKTVLVPWEEIAGGSQLRIELELGLRVRGRVVGPDRAPETGSRS